VKAHSPAGTVWRNYLHQYGSIRLEGTKKTSEEPPLLQKPTSTISALKEITYFF